jgi:hypothetical protein
MSDREELLALRRLAELEARAGAQPASQPPATPQAAPQAPQAPAPQAPAPSWSQVPGQMISNFLPSAGHLIGGLYEAVTSPVQTLKAAGDIAAGGLRAAVPESVRTFIDRFDNPETTQRISQAASAAGGMLADRYGSEEAIRRTLATDPVGFAADASMLLTGGGSAAARGGAFAQRVGQTGGAVARAGELATTAGEAATRVGQAIDPLAAAAKGVEVAGKGAGWVGSRVAGGLTGQGSRAVQEAAEAGFEGGKRGEAFREQMRGGDAAKAVEEAKYGLEQLRSQMQQRYQQNRQTWGNDATVLKFDNIDRALSDATDKFVFKGVVKNDEAAKVFTEMNEAIQQWKLLDPADFHTAAGLDALKQKLQGIVDGIPQNERTALAVATQVKKSVWNEIQRQAPTYAAAMKDYETASNLIAEIQRTLSTGDKATVDTQLRKLQSVMRDNVNTNWGQRAKLVQVLENAGAQDIMPMLAGQSSSALWPRGLQGLTAPAIAAGALFTKPYMIPLAMMTSPRLMGEAVHAGGRVVGGAQRLADVLSQMPGAQYAPTPGQAARLGTAVQRYQTQER